MCGVYRGMGKAGVTYPGSLRRSRGRYSSTPLPCELQSSTAGGAQVVLTWTAVSTS